MKSTAPALRPATGATVILAVDVSKVKLNLYTEIGSDTLDQVIANRTTAIEGALAALGDRARQARTERVLLVLRGFGPIPGNAPASRPGGGFDTAWVSRGTAPAHPQHPHPPRPSAKETEGPLTRSLMRCGC